MGCCAFFNTTARDPRVWTRLELVDVHGHLTNEDIHRYLSFAGKKLETLAISMNHLHLAVLLPFLHDQSHLSMIRIDSDNDDLDYLNWLEAFLLARNDTRLSLHPKLRIEIPDRFFDHKTPGNTTYHALLLHSLQQNTTVTINGFFPGKCDTSMCAHKSTQLVRQCTCCEERCCVQHWHGRCHSCMDAICDECIRSGMDDPWDDKEICSTTANCGSRHCTVYCFICRTDICKQCIEWEVDREKYQDGKVSCGREQGKCSACNKDICKGASNSICEECHSELCDECTRRCDNCKKKLLCTRCRMPDKPDWRGLTCKCTLSLCDQKACSMRHFHIVHLDGLKGSATVFDSASEEDSEGEEEDDD